MNRLDWRPIIERAGEIVRSYDTSVTLRQLFYRLVSEQLLPNTDESAYAAVLELEHAERELLRTAGAVIEKQRW